MRHHLILLGLALAFAAPLSAQEAPGASVPEAMPAAPPAAEQLPPPPPFPPMPSARPSHRWVDVSGHHRSSTKHKARVARHHGTKAKPHRRTHVSKRAAHKARPLHFSRKTIRQCHAMSYRQIMRHSSCRAMMMQELAAEPRHKAKAHKTRHHSKRKHKR
jgi:hypothetical protein